MSERLVGVDGDSLNPGDVLIHDNENFRYVILWRGDEHIVLESGGEPIKIRTEWISRDPGFRMIGATDVFVHDALITEEYFTAMEVMPQVAWHWVLDISQAYPEIVRKLAEADLRGL